MHIKHLILCSFILFGWSPIYTMASSSLLSDSEQIESDEICGICHQNLNNPIRLMCDPQAESTHNFCRDCLRKWGRRNQDCPMCRRHFDIKLTMCERITDTYHGIKVPVSYLRTGLCVGALVGITTHEGYELILGSRLRRYRTLPTLAFGLLAHKLLWGDPVNDNAFFFGIGYNIGNGLTSVFWTPLTRDFGKFLED